MRQRGAERAGAGGARRRRVTLAALLALGAVGAGEPQAGPEVTLRASSFAEEYGWNANVQVVAGPGGYLAAWQANPEGLHSVIVRAARLDAAGLLDPGGITLDEAEEVGASFSGPAVAAGDDATLVAWGRHLFYGAEESSVQAALVSPPGQAGPAVMQRVVVDQPTSPAGPLAAAFDAPRGCFLVAWRSSNQVRGRWVCAGGTTLEPAPPLEAYVISDGPTAMPFTQKLLGAACSSGGCMVAWEDAREGKASIYVAPVGAAGPGPEVQIVEYPDATTTTQLGLSLVADGENGGFLLTWAAGPGPYELAAALLDSSGMPQSADPTVLPSSGYARTPVLAPVADQEHVLVWTEEVLGGSEIQGTMLDTEGGVVPVTPSHPLISTGVGIPPTPAVACGGGGAPCWVMYTAYTELGPANTQVWGKPVLPPELGVPEGGGSTQISKRPAAQVAPGAACGRSGLCLSVWREPYSGPGAGGEVGAALLAPDAEDPLGLEEPNALSWLGFASNFTTPAVASSQLAPGAPARFLAAWAGDSGQLGSDVDGITAALLDERGVRATLPLGPMSIAQKLGPSVASDGERFVVVWGVVGLESATIRAARVGLDGSVPSGEEEGAPLIGDVGLEATPAVVYDGQAFLLVWQKNDAMTRALYGARLDASGPTLQLGEPFWIADGVPFGPRQAPALASEGDGISLVLWHDGSALRGVRLGPSGAQLGDPLVVVNSSQVRGARAVFDGEVYLAGWSEGITPDLEVRGAWIGQDGAVLSPGGFSLSSAPPAPAVEGVVRELALGSDGAGRTLLALERSRFDDGAGYVDLMRIRARLLGNPCAFGEAPVSCGKSECRAAGWCDPTAGACVGQAPKADGTACAAGLCVAGECVADPPSESGGGLGGSGGGVAGDSEDGGCGCRIREAGRGGGGAAAVMGALALLARRRRERRAPRP